MSVFLQIGMAIQSQHFTLKIESQKQILLLTGYENYIWVRQISYLQIYLILKITECGRTKQYNSFTWEGEFPVHVEWIFFIFPVPHIIQVQKKMVLNRGCNPYIPLESTEIYTTISIVRAMVSNISWVGMKWLPWGQRCLNHRDLSRIEIMAWTHAWIISSFYSLSLKSCWT